MSDITANIINLIFL